MFETSRFGTFKGYVSETPHEYGSLSTSYWINCLYCCLVFAFLSYSVIGRLSSAVVPRLRVVSQSERANFVCQVTSTANSVWSSLCAVYGYRVFHVTQSQDDAFQYFLYLSYVMTGYLVVDSLYKTLCTDQSFCLVWGHHTIAFILITFACVDSSYSNIKLSVLFMEISNPFVNFRIMLSIVSVSKSSWIYKTNGLLMTGSFFAVRILPIPYFVWSGIQLLRDDEENLSLTQKYMFYCFLILSIMNCYWFYRMLKGLLQALKYGKIE